MAIKTVVMADGTTVISGNVPNVQIHVEMKNARAGNRLAGSFDYTKEEATRFDKILENFVNDLEFLFRDVDKRVFGEDK